MTGIRNHNNVKQGCYLNKGDASRQVNKISDKMICGGSWRCGGSLVALQTTEAEIPGSNPATITVENSEGREGNLPEAKKKVLHLYVIARVPPGNS